jgi:O-antigen/teichoic acid export membrane protein
MKRSAGLAMLGGVVVIVGGYVLQLGLGRSVIPAEFAFLQETLAFYMMAMLPLQPIAAVVTKQAALHQDGLWSDLTRPWAIAALAVLSLTVMVLAGRGGAVDWDHATLVIFVLSVATGVALLIANSLAVGQLDFLGSALVQTLQASLRVALGLPFVLWGTGARGLWCATAIANGSAALYARRRVAGSSRTREPHVALAAPMKRDFAIAVCCYAGIAVLTQIDLVYARRSFPEITTYAGAALFGKLVFYLPAAASTVALPLLSRAQPGADVERLLKEAAALLGALSLSSFAVLVFVGGTVAGRVLGPAYARSGQFVLLSGLAVLPYGLVNLFASASLAAGRLRFATASLAGAIAMAIVAATGSVSLPAFAGSLAGVGLVLAIVGWLDAR